MSANPVPGPYPEVIIPLYQTNVNVNINEINGEPLPTENGIPVIPVKIVSNAIVSRELSANYFSPIDFSATYTSGTTITLSGVPFTIVDSTQIVGIKAISAAGVVTVFKNGEDNTSLTISSNVITYSGSVEAPFASGDVYYVGINDQQKAYDASTNSLLFSDLNPTWQRYTDAELLVTEQNLTSLYADFGSEIDMRGYNYLGLYVIADVNDSGTVDLKVLAKHTSGGTDEFDIAGLGVTSLWTASGSNDFKKYFEFDTATAPYVQIQAIAGTVGATPGDLTISYDKKWRN